LPLPHPTPAATLATQGAVPRLRALALLVLLGLIATSYVAQAPFRPAVPIALVAAAALGAMAQALAVAATLGVAPVIDGLMALVQGVSPLPPRTLEVAWTELLFLGTTFGIVARRLWTREKPRAASAAVRFYVLALLSVFAVVLTRDVGDWHSSRYLPLLMWSAVPDAGQGAPEHTVRAGLLLLAVPLWLDVVDRAVRTQSDLRRTRIAWLLGAMAAALFGQWMWTRGLGQVPPRVESLLDDVNSYGSYLVLSLFLAIVVRADDRRRGVRVLAGLSIVSTLWMLILSASRMALLATLAAGATIALLNLSRRRRRVVAIVALAALLLMTVISVPVLRTPSEPANPILRLLANATIPSRVAGYFVEMRQAVWSAAGRAFLAHPLAGIGPGRLYATLGDYYRPDDRGWRPLHENAHSYFLQLAAETGIVGLVAFGWLLSAALVPALRDRAGGLAGRRVLAIAALGYLATCVSGHPLIISRQVVLFWGFVGLLGLSAVRSDTSHAPAGRAAPWTVWALAPVFVAAVIMAPRRQCSAGAGGIGANYGLGFYVVESNATGTWRWMRDAGELQLCNTTGSMLVADVALPVTSFRSPRVLEATVADRFLVGHTANPDSVQRLILPSISLRPGWTTVGIAPAPRSERVDRILHNGDPRSVSVRVGLPSVSVRECSEAARISVTFGPGFYPAESEPTGTWRWMRRTGELQLCNGAATSVGVDITIPATSFNSPRTLSAYRDGRRLKQYIVNPGPMQRLTLPSIALPPGWSTVSLVPAPGPDAVDRVLHNSDRRSVSIRVGSPLFSVQPSR
jgi:O-Antigen ligase